MLPASCCSGSEGQPTAAQYERNSLLAAGTNLAKTILGVGGSCTRKPRLLCKTCNCFVNRPEN